MKGKVGRATQHDGLGSRAPNLLDAITSQASPTHAVGNAFGLRVSGFPSAFIKNSSTSTGLTEVVDS